VEVGADYAPFVNYGHNTRGDSHVPARPFWEPALQQLAKEFNGIVKEEVWAP
jgi:hypothetical protein